jgi:predicted Rossmann fold nucleotide-binding protein DprA/Smf involved in DNA uptake
MNECAAFGVERKTVAWTIGGRLRDRFHPLVPIHANESNTPEDRVLRILAQAPATVTDLSRLTGISTQDIYVLMRRLTSQRRVVRSACRLTRNGMHGAQHFFSVSGASRG